MFDVNEHDSAGEIRRKKRCNQIIRKLKDRSYRATTARMVEDRVSFEASKKTIKKDFDYMAEEVEHIDTKRPGSEKLLTVAPSVFDDFDGSASSVPEDNPVPESKEVPEDNPVPQTNKDNNHPLFNILITFEYEMKNIYDKKYGRPFVISVSGIFGTFFMSLVLLTAHVTQVPVLPYSEYIPVALIFYFAVALLSGVLFTRTTSAPDGV